MTAEFLGMATMNKFTKRPITVFAEQYLGDYLDADILPFGNDPNLPKYEYKPDAARDGGKGMWRLKTAEGWQWLHKDMWVLRNEFSEFDNRYYVRADNIFRMTYEAI